MEGLHEIKRGEIYFADLGDNSVGSEQNGTRPVVVIQNNIGNKYSPTVIVACVTSQNKTQLPTHVKWEDSTILCEQLKTIDKSRLRWKMGTLSFGEMQNLNRAIRVSLDV